MLRGVGAGRVSSSCVSGPVRSARLAYSHWHPRLRPRQDPTSAAWASPQDLRVEPGPQQNAPRGSRSRSLHLLLDSPSRASRRRISPWSPLRGYAHGTGVRRRVHNPPTLGAPGARHPDDCTIDQAGGDWGGWPPHDHRSHLVGPGRLDSGRNRPGGTGPVKRGAIDSDARCASEQDGLQVKPGRGTKPARRPRPRGKEVVPDGQGGRHRFPHPGPISGPDFFYPHHGSDGSAPEEASGPRFAL
jgi:hypothetical protein